MVGKPVKTATRRAIRFATALGMAAVPLDRLLIETDGLRLRAARQREEADDGGEERHPAAWRLLT